MTYFESIVHRARYSGDEVNILTGVHGRVEEGALSMSPERAFYNDDVHFFGQYAGVTVHDLPSLSAAEITKLLQSPGTTIGAFCESGACLARFK